MREPNLDILELQTLDAPNEQSADRSAWTITTTTGTLVTLSIATAIT